MAPEGASVTTGLGGSSFSSSFLSPGFYLGADSAASEEVVSHFEELFLDMETAGLGEGSAPLVIWLTVALRQGKVLCSLLMAHEEEQ